MNPRNTGLDNKDIKVLTNHSQFTEVNHWVGEVDNVITWLK